MERTLIEDSILKSCPLPRGLYLKRGQFESDALGHGASNDDLYFPAADQAGRSYPGDHDRLFVMRLPRDPLLIIWLRCRV
jgi:hypothetical protein